MHTTIVIGKKGQLARELKRHIPNVVSLGRDDIDITNYSELTRTLDQFRIDRLINASAYTKVDQAETDKETAFLINCDAVKNMAKYASSKKIKFVHVSTDYVFSGLKKSPYSVSDKCNPINVYGASKLAGEIEVKKHCGDFGCILRTSWLYSCFGDNFVTKMLNLMKNNTQISVVDDQTGCPTNAFNLARACLAVSESDLSGVLHFTDLGHCTWYEFALEIHRLGIKYGLLKNEILIRKVSSRVFPGMAKRPKYSVLSKESLPKGLSKLKTMQWQLALEQAMIDITNNT